MDPPSLETAALRSASRTDRRRHSSRARLRGDGFGDGFGGDYSLVGRSTGGTSGPAVASTAPSEGGSPGWLRLRVTGSSPASGASQPSAPQSLSDAQFSPSGAGDGLVTVSGSLSGVGTRSSSRCGHHDRPGAICGGSRSADDNEQRRRSPTGV